METLQVVGYHMEVVEVAEKCSELVVENCSELVGVVAENCSELVDSVLEVVGDYDEQKVVVKEMEAANNEQEVAMMVMEVEVSTLCIVVVREVGVTVLYKEVEIVVVVDEL